MRFRIHAMLRCLAWLASTAWLGGCASTPFNVTAMRFDSEPPRERTFQIANPQISGAGGAVTAERLTNSVDLALINRGFRPATPGLPAGMVIEVVFEQQPPRVETRTGTEKVYQWQPERTVLTPKQTKTSTGLVFTETVPRKVPAHSEAVASRTVNYLVKIFPKRLRIIGRTQEDPAAGEVGRPLWSVEVRNDNEVHDLERFAVRMIAAAMDHLGDDFSGEKTVFVSAGDKRTQVIRGPGPRSSQPTGPR